MRVITKWMKSTKRPRTHKAKDGTSTPICGARTTNQPIKLGDWDQVDCNACIGFRYLTDA